MGTCSECSPLVDGVKDEVTTIDGA